VLKKALIAKEIAEINKVRNSQDKEIRESWKMREWHLQETEDRIIVSKSLQPRTMQLVRDELEADHASYEEDEEEEEGEETDEDAPEEEDEEVDEEDFTFMVKVVSAAIKQSLEAVQAKRHEVSTFTPENEAHLSGFRRICMETNQEVLRPYLRNANLQDYDDEVLRMINAFKNVIDKKSGELQKLFMLSDQEILPKRFKALETYLGPVSNKRDERKEAAVDEFFAKTVPKKSPSSIVTAENLLSEAVNGWVKGEGSGK
jgi:hypothetical protein